MPSSPTPSNPNPNPDPDPIPNPIPNPNPNPNPIPNPTTYLNPNQVANAICLGLGRDTKKAVDECRKMNMFLDDFTCCKATCGEAC